jgi:hypothetical protein
LAKGATLEELNTRCIKGVKPLFLPGTSLKRSLKGIMFDVYLQTFRESRQLGMTHDD